MSLLPIPFDNPRTYPGHSGVDYPKARGTIFRASGPGIVVSRSRNSRGGFFVWVQYDNGPRVGYHHMDSHDGVPTVGTRVQEGTQLGYVGSLGKYSTGPHLHSEVSGYATTEGYWRFFDRNRVVGQHDGGNDPTPTPDPNPTPESEEDEMYFTFVQGKSGSHRSGVFAHLRDNKGVWFAKRINFDEANTQNLPVIANTQLASWQGTMKFNDLT